MSVQPTVIVAGEPKLVEALGRMQHNFPHILAADSASELLPLLTDPRVEQAEALCYIMSGGLNIDIPSVTFDLICGQLTDAGHTVLVVPKGEDAAQVAENRGLPTIKPRMNPVTMINDAVGGVDRGVGSDGPPKVAPQGPTEIERKSRWADARHEASSSKSRELAPVPGAADRWGSAISTARDRGRNTMGSAPRGFVIVFAARKGGVGKTTLAVNSAANLGKSLRGTGRSVCLVDMNFQQADIGSYLGREKPNVTKIIHRQNLLHPDHIEDALVYREDENFFALLGPSSIEEASPNQVNTALYRQIIEVLQERFDYILIDTPVAERYHQVLDYALPKANFIITPVTPNRVGLEKVREWLDSITQPSHAGGYGIEPTKIGLVLNKAKLGIHCDPQDVEDMMTNYPWLGLLPDSDAWQDAENTGRLIGGNPPEELAEPFRYMLYKATRAPELRKKAQTKEAREARDKKGKPWWKRILASVG